MAPSAHKRKRFLTQLLEAINFVFNFRKKISANMEGMQALTAHMKT